MLDSHVQGLSEQGLMEYFAHTCPGLPRNCPLHPIVPWNGTGWHGMSHKVLSILNCPLCPTVPCDSMRYPTEPHVLSLVSIPSQYCTMGREGWCRMLHRVPCAMPQSPVYSTVPLTLLREGIPISHWTVYGNAGQPSLCSVVVKAQPTYPPTDKALPILYTVMHLVCCVRIPETKGRGDISYVQHLRVVQSFQGF